MMPAEMSGTPDDRRRAKYRFKTIYDYSSISIHVYYDKNITGLIFGGYFVNGFFIVLQNTAYLLMACIIVAT